MEPEIITLTIGDVVYRGKGLARLDGKVVFVPGVLTGETISAEITARHRNYTEARCVEILQPSPHRIAPICPLSAVCPGCSYQHVAYEEEVRLKQLQLVGFLQRQGKADPSVCQPPSPSPASLGYRNKISLHAAADDGTLKLGYIAADNHTVIDVPACPLAMAPLNALLGELRSDPSLMQKAASFHSVILRHTKGDGAFHLFGKGGSGKPWLTESTLMGSFHVPRHSFFQVNRGAADSLLAAVMEVLKQTGATGALDLYCGVGVFAVAAHKAGCSKVAGIDFDENAIAAAKQNAHDHRMGAVDFIARPAIQGIRHALRSLDPSRTAVIADPPRTGLDREVIVQLAQHRPAHILYVSCAADTLARDLALLVPAGYRIRSSHLFDMFPRTPYFESLTWLTQ